MPADLATFLVLTGRILIGGLFFYAGTSHFALVPTLTKAIAARGLPCPHLILLGGSSIQIVAGAALVLGIFVAVAALVLAVFTVAASVMLLNFWDMKGDARVTAQHTFQSNIAVLGGLLITAAHAM